MVILGEREHKTETLGAELFLLPLPKGSGHPLLEFVFLIPSSSFPGRLANTHTNQNLLPSTEKKNNKRGQPPPPVLLSNPQTVPTFIFFFFSNRRPDHHLPSPDSSPSSPQTSHPKTPHRRTRPSPSQRCFSQPPRSPPSSPQHKRSKASFIGADRPQQQPQQRRPQIGSHRSQFCPIQPSTRVVCRWRVQRNPTPDPAAQARQNR